MSQHALLRASPPHPALYLVLNLPFGISGGFITVTLGYLLAQRGVSAAQVATVVAAELLPQTWRFLWAPLVDTTLGSKAWYLVGAAGTSAGILACGLMPATRDGLFALTAVVFLMSVATTLVAMAIESMMPHQTPDELKGRASGWFQAGNLGGAGLGGGAGLWLAEHLTAAWLAPAALALACLLCALLLLWLDEPRARSATTAGDGAGCGGATVAESARARWARVLSVLRELWSLARSRNGYLGLLIVFLPIGTGAASNLWSAVADGWRASADAVALANGAISGVVSMFGCLVGGHLCDRLERKLAYALFGVVQAACVVAMALAPHDASMYVLFTLVYAFLTGTTYAAYSAVALEAIGTSAAATQFNAYASLANMPILYMGLLEGWAYDRFGASWMLYTEALAALAGIAVFVLASAGSRPRATARAGST